MVQWLFLETGPWPEGSYELGLCFRLSVRPSFWQFWLRIGSLGFSETLYDVAIWRCAWRARFFWKNPLPAKRPKNGGFGVFRKICSLVFACKFCRMKVLMTKNCIWTKIWFSRYGQKCCQPIRFQYSLIINISLMDWHLALIFCMWINSLSGQTGRFWPKNGTSS